MKRLALLAVLCLSCSSSKRSVIVVSLSYDASVKNADAIKNLRVTVEGSVKDYAVPGSTPFQDCTATAVSPCTLEIDTDRSGRFDISISGTGEISDGGYSVLGTGSGSVMADPNKVQTLPIQLSCSGGGCGTVSGADGGAGAGGSGGSLSGAGGNGGTGGAGGTAGGMPGAGGSVGGSGATGGGGTAGRGGMAGGAGSGGVAGTTGAAGASGAAGTAGTAGTAGRGGTTGAGGAAGGGVIFSDDFEDGTYNKWTIGNSTSAYAVTAVTAADGTAHSFRITGGNNFYNGANVMFAPAKPQRLTFWARAGALDTTTYASNCYFALSADTFARQNILSITISGNRSLPMPMGSNVWYHYDVSFDWSAGTTTASINGGAPSAPSPFNVSPAPQSVTRLDLFCTTAVAVGFWDQIVIGP